MRGMKPEIAPTGEPPPDGIPGPPDWLGDDAREVWARLLPVLLNERRTLASTDLDIFANYCEACGTIQEMTRVLKAEGQIFQGPSGPKRHPASAIRSEAMTQAKQMAAELGLTPASRGRPAIKNGGDDGQSDLFGL